MSDTVARIKRSMQITAADVDAYSVADEAMTLRPASEYVEEVWQYITTPYTARGAQLPWQETHQDIQVRPGELSLWTGKRKSFKSMVTGQAMLSLIQQNERVAIASMEMPIEDTLSRMECQALAVQNPSRAAHDAFYKWAADRLWLYTQGGTVKAERLLAFTRFAVAEREVKHIVLDSLMMVGFDGVRSSFDKIEKQEGFVRSLATIARDTGAHIHLVAHHRKSDVHGARAPDADDIKGGGGMADLASVVYIVAANAKKQAEASKPNPKPEIMEQPDAWLEVAANRRGPSGSRWGLHYHAPSMQLTRHRGRGMQTVPELANASFGTASETTDVDF